MDRGSGKMDLTGGFMIYLKYCAMLSVLAVLAIGVITCTPQETTEAVDEPPLLLDDHEDESDDEMADNSRCHVCHINYAEEWLAVKHAKAGMKCEQCHGDSDTHASDEDNITPPDTMYPIQKVNSFCMSCHGSQTIDQDQHKPVLACTAKKNKYCTDCHGEHRLGYRTRQWDKTTGKLIEDDKVRMTTE